MDKECLKIIKLRVRSFHRSTGIDFDELESEAMEAYVNALASFDETKGVKFKTFLFKGVTQKLVQFCRDWYDMLPAIYLEDAKLNGYDDDGEEIFSKEMPIPAPNDMTVEKLMFEQWRKRLTPKAQGVIELLNTCANELITYSLKKKHRPHSRDNLRGALMRYLEALNWKKSDIKRVFAEIERKLVTL